MRRRLKPREQLEDQVSIVRDPLGKGRGEPSSELASPDFRAFFESSPDLILVIAPDLTIVAATDAFCEATFTRRERIVGRKVFDVFPDDNPSNPSPSGVANLGASLSRVLASKRPDQMPLQRYDLARPDGGFDERYWLPSNTPVLDPDGQVRYIIHRAVDATADVRLNASEASRRAERAESRRAEAEANELLAAQAAELRARHDEISALYERLREHMEHVEAESSRLWSFSLDMLGVADASGYFRRVNPAFVRALGWSEEDLTTRPFIEFVHPEDVAATQAEMHRLRQGASVLDFVNRYRCKDGSYRWLAWRVNPVGEALYCVARDVTEQRRISAEFERQRALTERIIENAPLDIAYMNRDRVLVWCNSNFARTLGLTPENVLGRAASELLHPEMEAPLCAIFEGGLEGEPYYGTAFPLKITHDGQERWTHWDFTYQPVRNEAGQVDGVLILAQEVSERVEHERSLAEKMAALQEADRLKDQFLSILSHELRTPINAITGFVSILDDEILGPINSNQHGAMGKVLAAADRLLSLVNDLLDMSRIQAGKFTLAPRAIDLPAVAEDVLASMAIAADGKRIQLRRSLPADVPAVYADEQRVAQVLSNLVGNAIKFTQQGGWVEVRLCREGAFLRIEVEDNGPGIPEEKHAILFEPFTQMDMSYTRQKGGVGLGLTICKSLIEAQGGEIGLASAPGRGATFWFTLPLAQQVGY